jgi:hypothetical protein
VTAIVDEYSCDIPFVNMCHNDHGICVWEGYEFDVSFGKGYQNVRPFGSHDWALDRHMIDLAVILSLLSLVLEIYVGASSYGVDGSKGHKIDILMGRFCGLWLWWKCIWFWLWLNHLRGCCRVCYL